MGNLNLGGLTWAMARLVMVRKDDPPQGEGPSKDANKHDNPAEVTTFPESICYNAAGWPGGRVVPLAAVGSGHEGCPMAALGPPSFLPV